MSEQRVIHKLVARQDGTVVEMTMTPPKPGAVTRCYDFCVYNITAEDAKMLMNSIATAVVGMNGYVTGGYGEAPEGALVHGEGAVTPSLWYTQRWQPATMEEKVDA
jgi:hypothetical protein